MNATRRAVLASLLVALIVAAGYALAGVPNVELVSFLVFVSGFLLGVRLGALVGGVAMGVHSLFNVMGAAVPPVLAAQVAAYAAIGSAGGAVGPFIERLPRPAVAALVAGATGLVLVLGYQLLVGVVTYFAFARGSLLWAYLWGGIVFSAVHIAWNTALFLLAMRPTLSVLARYRLELGGTA